MQFLRLVRGVLLAALVGTSVAQAGTLTIESWRVDDKTLWETVLIPAFQKTHPGIEVKFVPTAVMTEYDANLTARLTGGTAGDLITCRPFDVSLSLYKKRHLEKLDGKSGMENFPASAKVAWQTDDHKDTFCMPLASVIHGFLYNKKIFRELNLQQPKTEEEFIKVLEAVKKNGKYAALALGTADKWESNEILFTSIGANYWKGEEGRKALLAGRAKFTDPQFVAAFNYETTLGKYLTKRAEAQTYGDSQKLFAQGKAAVYPTGSWDIPYFNQAEGLDMGVFPPPVRKVGDKCYISDQTDIGMGINRKSKNREDAYKFLSWLGSQEFADIYTNRLIGFFSLSNHAITVKDPVARQMLDWRTSCASTIRLNAQVMNRGMPNMEDELRNVNARVLNGTLPAKEAAAKVQAGFANWYKPQQK